MKMAVHKKLRAAERCRQFVFMPDVLSRAGEYGLGMGAVAAQFAGEADDPINVGPGAVFLSFRFESAHGFPRQVLDQDRIFLMRLIPRGGGLKIETDSTRLVILKLGQLTDLFASNTHG